MATDVERLAISLEARVNQFERQLKKAERDLDGSANNIENRAARMSRKVEREVDGMGERMAGSLRGAFAPLAGIIAGALSVEGIRQASDAYTRVQNSLKVAGLEGDALTGTFNELFAIAQRNGTALEPLVGLYSGLAQAQKELNATGSELTQFTEGVSLALRVAGTDAQSASGALLQLRQAMGSGRVSAEEYNSILEGARPVLQAVAAGMVEAGGSVAQLTRLVKDGEVSSEAFFRAFIAGRPLLEDMASRTAPTVSQGIAKIQNAFFKLVGEVDKVSGASTALGNGLNNVAGFFSDTLTPSVVAATQALIDYKNAVSAALAAAGNSRLFGGALSADQLRAAGLEPVTDADRAPPAASVPTPPVITPIRNSNFRVNSTGTGGGGGGGAERADAFEREVEAIKRRTEALRLENTVVGQSSFEVARAKAEHELLRAAKQEEYEMTPQLVSQIRSLANAYAVQSEDLEAARQKQQAFIDMQRFAGQAISGFLSDIVSGGRNAQEALMNLLKRLSEVMLQAALLGDGPLGGIFGMRGQGGAPGGLIGALFGPFGGARATGGPVTAGTSYLVGERGPELFTARSSGMIVPNEALRSGGGQSGRVEVIVTVAPSGEFDSRVARVSGAVSSATVKQALNAFAPQVPGIVADAERRRV
jgi:tape measure domain-containing protein